MALALVAATMLPVAFAQDAEGYEEDDFDLYGEDGGAGLELGGEEEAAAVQSYAHPDVTTSILFENHMDKEFPPGETVDVVVGVSNGANTEINVTYITASLVMPNDFGYFVENYTAWRYATFVHPNEEGSFVYRFTPNENFDPRPFGLMVLVYYSDAEENLWLSAAYNSTIAIVDAAPLLDASTAFRYVAGFLVLATAAYLYFSSSSSSPNKSSKRAAVKVEAGTAPAGLTEDDVDFLPAHLRKKVIGGKTKKSSGKNKRK
ncbi:signal sequence receptor [Thecamonas trahens ATCC 50062]|uniref:Signal sequence receptor n=1 Tax=Thecamonas trahens ATCC 50062 TaxID=461836 RepID=A0A0L0D722_THETB|nr:signal sequence receptor [Thecamonas trahens ATCC 50062]KNC48010.1 signal sequence receptor [Thecamonas trahens ATCC 50062]|eukprot:XP_013759025.1 signal sequence receptor [Thecamonas trahens ATCC 50062]